jgi:hypothetical protein
MSEPIRELFIPGPDTDWVEYWLGQALAEGNVDPEVTREAVRNALAAYLESRLTIGPLPTGEMVEYDGRYEEGFDALEPKRDTRPE